jgi:hypothetical protein
MDFDDGMTGLPTRPNSPACSDWERSASIVFSARRSRVTLLKTAEATRRKVKIRKGGTGVKKQNSRNEAY